MNPGNGCRTSLSDSNSNRDRNGSSGYMELDSKIRLLPFDSFHKLVLLWLGAKGYRHIRPLGRYHRRGRRAVGGADFLALEPGSSITVAVQVRHWRTPITRRAVDELWGFMLRRGVPTGLVVTNTSFSTQAVEAALSFPGRPIRLIARGRLAAWLASSGLGLKTVAGKDELDDRFFRALESIGLAGSSSDKPGTAALTKQAQSDNRQTGDWAGGETGPVATTNHSRILAIAITILVTLATLLVVALRRSR